MTVRPISEVMGYRSPLLYKALKGMVSNSFQNCSKEFLANILVCPVHLLAYGGSKKRISNPKDPNPSIITWTVQWFIWALSDVPFPCVSTAGEFNRHCLDHPQVTAVFWRTPASCQGTFLTNIWLLKADNSCNINQCQVKIFGLWTPFSHIPSGISERLNKLMSLTYST